MKYLYYRLWHFFKKIKTNDMPATNAMIFISVCEFANIFLIYIFLRYNQMLEVKINSRSDALIYAIPLGIIVYSINYFYLYKYRNELYDKYKNETNKQKYMGNILLALYVLGSFVLVFYFGSKYAAIIMN